MRTISKTFKKYWDVFGGMAFGILSSLLVKWEIEKIQLIYSVTILILIFIGLMKTIFHKDRTNKKELSMVDKLVDFQKPIKAIDISENPTKDGEELGYIVLEQVKGWKKTMQKIKKFFKWIWLYKEQLVGFLAAFVYAGLTIYAYIFDKFGWLLQYFPEGLGWEIAVKILVGLVSIVFIFYIIRNQAKHVGVGGLEYATEVLKERGKEFNNALSTTSQKFVEERLNKLYEAKKVLVAEFDEVKKVFNLTVQELNSMKELADYGVGDTQVYSEKQKKLSELSVDVKKYETEIAALEKQIKDNEKVLYC